MTAVLKSEAGPRLMDRFNEAYKTLTHLKHLTRIDPPKAEDYDQTVEAEFADGRLKIWLKDGRSVAAQFTREIDPDELY